MMSGGGTPPTPPPTGLVYYDYIYFDGTAYIQTDYVLPTECSFKCQFGYETLKAGQRIFRATGGGGTTSFSLGSATSSSTRKLVIYYDSSSSLASTQGLGFSYNTYNFFLTPLKYGVGNNSFSITKGSNHPTGGLAFGNDGSGGTTYTGRMGVFRVYGSDAKNVSSASGFDSYTPVATFRPCTYNGEPGFWYVEGDEFFGNSAGSGTLTVSNS
jgi:hypothetical protein